jgi:hypothetical protein
MQKIISLILFAAIAGSLASCSSPKTVSKTEAAKTADTLSFRYRFHVLTLGALPGQHHDEIWIDTTGQMRFNSDQHRRDSTWTQVPSMAYLEPRDEDTLLSFLKHAELFSIDESDVTPQCPTGETYSFIIYRSDLKKTVRFKTNTCAAEFNLLTGVKRKLFPGFLAYVDRLRDRYRPSFMD